MVSYNNERLYIESAEGYAAKALAVDAIINALLLLAATEAGQNGVSEYSLNDGQVQIRAAKRGSSAIMASIADYEKLKQYYITKSKGGRMTRLVDSRNFIGTRH
jgi:hypothetical protein